MTQLIHLLHAQLITNVRAVSFRAAVRPWGTVVHVLVRITAHVILHAAKHVTQSHAPADIRVHIIQGIRMVPSTMAAVPAVLKLHFVPSQRKRVIHHVHRLQIAKHAAGQNRVPVRAAFQMVHVHTAVQPVHISIHVAAIIQVVAVSLRVRHVRDVIHGHAPVPVNVPVAQSALHAMRGLICPMAHVPNAKQDITAPGTTVEDNVQVQHIRMKQEKRHVNHAQPQQNMLRWYHTIGIGHQMV